MRAREEIFGNPSKHELALMQLIAQRMKNIMDEMGIEYADLLTICMDIQAAHAHCPLKLEELLQARDFDFIHDVSGIKVNLNRKTGKLENSFIPRYAKPREPLLSECIGCGCNDDVPCIDTDGKACYWQKKL